MIISTVSVGGGKRFAYLDALKCLGILLVISGHVQFLGMSIEAYDSPSSLMLYSFNMPLFFFVSGYLALKLNTIGNIGELKKLGNKFLYLVLPAVVFYCFSSFSEHGIGGIFDFIKSGFGKYWFTYTLFEMFVLFYIVNGFSRSKNMLAVTLAILSIIGVGYLSVFNNRFDIAFFDFNRLSKYFQFFTLGVYAKIFVEQYDKLMRNEYFKAMAIIGFFGLLFSLYQVSMPSVVYHFLRDIVLRYLGLYVVISFFYCNQEKFNSNSRWNNLILKIGQNSLAIYLLQYFFMPNFSAFPEWLAGLDTLSTFAISFAYTIFATALCMVFIELLSNSVFVKRYVLGKK